MCIFAFKTQILRNNWKIVRDTTVAWLHLLETLSDILDYGVLSDLSSNRPLAVDISIGPRWSQQSLRPGSGQLNTGRESFLHHCWLLRACVYLSTKTASQNSFVSASGQSPAVLLLL